MPIVDQYTYFVLPTSKNCSWYLQMEKVIEIGKSPVGEMDAIPTDTYLDTRIKISPVMNINLFIYFLYSGGWILPYQR